ncbi:phosphohydrolase [Chitinophagaceae bacterium LB-8]|uniref:Phosphohydrolase n=1 Tax=Paraflavisolibacter caeni TaxID=2982496 RepID=A0A9X2XNI6_9BACT|nr:phosphohydrolase [Paraflavisolibacter caeni]MCU7548309.1 phosphohydrolase [Paraflavisolibacter caeni]
MATLEKAIEIAVNAHKGQLDRYGAPFLMHVFRVMNAGKNKNEKIAGVLHDIVEKTDYTFGQLQAEGFSTEIILAVKCLTKESEDEDYNDYIKRVKTNFLAVKVKLNDLTDNLDLKRISELTEKDIPRFNKYLKAYKELIEL